MWVYHAIFFGCEALMRLEIWRIVTRCWTIRGVGDWQRRVGGVKEVRSFMVR
jgi:hypothetical protein